MSALRRGVLSLTLSVCGCDAADVESPDVDGAGGALSAETNPAGACEVLSAVYRAAKEARLFASAIAGAHVCKTPCASARDASWTVVIDAGCPCARLGLVPD